MTGTVETSLKNGVRTIMLNRPERLNAINTALLAEFNGALKEAAHDPECRAIVLRGAGRAFCSGDDLKEFPDQSRDRDSIEHHVNSIQDVTRAIVLGEKMVIGAVHGWAVGGGLEWAINCDITIMADGTGCFFPEVYLGMHATGASTTLLPKMIGLQRARALILFGDRFDAAAALNMGLVWKVVPEAELFGLAQETAERIVDLPEVAVREFKRVINRACYMDVEGALELETEATIRTFLDPKTAEYVRAFAG